MRPEAGFEQQAQAWLAHAQQRYQEAPDRASRLLDELLQLFEPLPEPPTPELPALELALLLFQIGFEHRRPHDLSPLIERALRWAEAGREPRWHPRLWCLAARLRLTQQRFDDAAGLLQRARRALDRGNCDDLLAPAALAHSLSLLARAQADPERALVHARRAVELGRDAGDHGAWLQTHTHLAIVLRMLGRQEERQAVLLEGRERALASRRWGEAVNLSAGLVDMAVERGELAQAGTLLAQAETLLIQGEVDAQASGRLALRCARARWLAASAQPGPACALIEPMLDAIQAAAGQRELLRSLDELQAWKLAQGLGDEALALSRRAHALRLDLDGEAQGHEALHLRQQIELAQAETERREQDQRAAQAEAQQQALQVQLDQLRALQEELAERRQQASMAPLLAGVAHELNTPLGNALTGLSSAVEQARGLLDTGGAALGRQLLLARLQALLDAQQLVQRNLQRALALVESYQPATARDAAAATLERLVERAWQRALAPGHRLALQLEDGVGRPVWPGQAIEEVLVQMFQNIERHAYAPGEAGPVRVAGCWHEGASEARLLLTVQDQGRGIEAALLPHVFEPYVSTQFGRGRSGLGLFIAQAVVRQQLGGRLRVHSRPGGGSRFEIECASQDGPAEGLRRQVGDG